MALKTFQRSGRSCGKHSVTVSKDGRRIYISRLLRTKLEAFNSPNALVFQYDDENPKTGPVVLVPVQAASRHMEHFRFPTEESNSVVCRDFIEFTGLEAGQSYTATFENGSVTLQR